MEFRFIDDDAVSQSRKTAKILEVFFFIREKWQVTVFDFFFFL
mgnify:CR=1 FL=1